MSAHGEGSAIRAVAIDASSSNGGFRVLAGQRLTQFRDDYGALPEVALHAIGTAGIVSRDRTEPLPPAAFAPHEADTFEIEIAGISPETAESARDVLGLFFPDEAAEALVREGVAEPPEWSFDGVRPAPAALGPGAHAFDLCIATFRERRHCLQHCQIAVGDEWLVCLWQEPCGTDGAAVTAHFPLPGSRVRHHFTRTDVVGDTGQDRLARLIQDVMRHNEYQAELMSAVIEDWERRFFLTYAGAADERDSELEKLQPELAALRDFLSATHIANKTVWRRAQNQPAFPRAVQAEILDRCRRLEAVLDERRSELRESFNLLAGAAAEQQARAARGTQSRMATLTGLATYATGLVLVPGLVAAIYGADVLGLPGQGRSAGLIYLLLASVLAAAITVGIFARARREDR